MAVNLLNPGCGGDDCYPCDECDPPVVTCEFIAGDAGATFDYEITDATSAMLVVTCDDPDSVDDIETETEITLTSGAATGSVAVEVGCKTYCIYATNECGPTSCCKTVECENFADYNGYAYLCDATHCCPHDGFIEVAIDLGTLPNSGSTTISLSDFNCSMIYSTWPAHVRVDYSTTLYFTNVRMVASTGSNALYLSFLATISWYDGTTTQTVHDHTFLYATWPNVCNSYGALPGTWIPYLYKILDPGGSPVSGFDAAANGCHPLGSGVGYFARIEGLPACP